MKMSTLCSSAFKQRLEKKLISRESRFVYIYSSTVGSADVPVYVGRGTSDRVQNHGNDDSNTRLASIIATGKYAVEILDCGDDRTAEVVEGALISAMLGRSKVDLTNSRRDTYQFSPLGVPVALSSRRGMPALTPVEIAVQANGPVLFVRIGANALNNPERGVINPGNPSPQAVADRLRQWWQIEPMVRGWEEAPETAPLALVGIAGGKHRYVVGAVDLKNFDWDTLDLRGKSVSFPHSSKDADLDCHELRGRTIKDGPTFSLFPPVFARVYNSAGLVDRPTPGMASLGSSAFKQTLGRSSAGQSHSSDIDG